MLVFIKRISFSIKPNVYKTSDELFISTLNSAAEYRTGGIRCVIHNEVVCVPPGDCSSGVGLKTK